MPTTTHYILEDECTSVPGTLVPKYWYPCRCQVPGSYLHAVAIADCRLCGSKPSQNCKRVAVCSLHPPDRNRQSAGPFYPQPLASALLARPRLDPIITLGHVKLTTGSLTPSGSLRKHYRQQSTAPCLSLSFGSIRSVLRESRYSSKTRLWSPQSIKFDCFRAECLPILARVAMSQP